MAIFGGKRWFWKLGAMWVLWGCICRKHSRYFNHRCPWPMSLGWERWGEIQLVSVGTCNIAGGADSVLAPLALPRALLCGHTCPPLPSASVCSMH